jgi:DNA/RNA-binding domain of Phe-tRNA-synthetase-like protein
MFNDQGLGFYKKIRTRKDQTMEVKVNERIFQEFPLFRRGIVVASEIQNQGISKELETLLSGAVESAGRQAIDVKADPRIVVWSEAHRRFGSNPNKFPPAHFSLMKRVLKPGTHLPFINKVVTVMNYNSIVDVIPVGGDDLGHAGPCLELRYASGQETFVPLDAPQTTEHPAPGEVIYVVADSGKVMCRRWNWRNGYETRITEETRAMVMNIDGLGDGIESGVAKTRDRVAAMLEKYCGARTLTTMLSPAQPSFRFEA